MAEEDGPGGVAIYQTPHILVADDVAELPTGTVTFLFTDLEGSTRLWEDKPEAMKAGYRVAKAAGSAGKKSTK